MSLVSWHLSPARVDLVTDTLAYDRTYTGLFHTTKFFTLPHARLIVADMGPAVSAFELQRRMGNCDLPRGIDDVVVRGPGWMKQIQADFLAEHDGSLNVEQQQNEWHLVAFGYSEERQRVIGYIFNSPSEFQPVPIPDGDAINPPLTLVDWSDSRAQKIGREHRAELTRFKSPDSFIAAAKLQQLTAQRMLGGGIGGDLLMATLTRDRLEVRKFWSFPALETQEEMAHAS